MTAVGIAIAALLLLSVLVKGKQVRIGSVVIGVVVGLLFGATPVGPAADSMPFADADRAALERVNPALGYGSGTAPGIHMIGKASETDSSGG